MGGRLVLCLETTVRAAPLSPILTHFLVPIASSRNKITSRCHHDSVAPAIATKTSFNLAVDPKMPPSVLIISTAAWWRFCSLAAQQSSMSRQSNPRSFPSRIVVWTQTSVVTPQTNILETPFIRSNDSKSVCAKVPLPGLSITCSPSLG
jgi:hypothetical protein